MIRRFSEFQRLARLLGMGALVVALTTVWPAAAISGEDPRDNVLKERARAEMLADEAKEDRTNRRANLHLGRAPWICTPSGFGQTASCFQRASMQLPLR